ncbi:hypothetical protein SAMN03159338_1607 [Sphingomonas sp. NFR04]|jgi:hypothetical protein|uniref:major capsid protein n=1 Tax=Sphingomonas sp. NFR04 TaxID=1566283 RepID=UPI0008E2279C|nr:phage major capsid protein [Sphingomonas sp. NFR04]SFJ50880.1 hypothetical protein SAMN03159338_1607 [Sphingomonas sp. NFR04]
MPLLRVEAEKLSNNVLEQGVIEEIIDNDAMFAMLPFKRVVGKAYMYNREKTLSEGEFLDPYDTVPEGGAEFDEVVAKLRILIGDVDIDNFLDETMSDTNDQTATQIAAKAKGMARKFQRTLATGNSGTDPKSFDGISELCADNQVLPTSGDGEALTFERLDQLLRMVPLGADALVMRGGTHDAILAMLRNLGGTTPNDVTLPGTGISVPAYRRTPIIINDFLPGDELHGTKSKSCSIYAVRFNEADGMHGIFGGPTAGFRVQSIGTVQNKDVERYRMKWYCGTALKSTRSLARLKGITNI